jgi:hypothetical protein
MWSSTGPNPRISTLTFEMNGVAHASLGTFEEGDQICLRADVRTGIDQTESSGRGTRRMNPFQENDVQRWGSRWTANQSGRRTHVCHGMKARV